MALSFKGVVVTLDGTTQSIASLLATVLNGNKFVYGLAVLPYASNQNPTYIGKSGMTGADSALGVATTTASFSLSGGGIGIKIDDLYLKGTNQEKVYLNVMA